MEENVVIVKPQFNIEPIADLPTLKPIKHNFGLVKEFVEDIVEYYKTVEFTDDQVKDASEEKTKLNKLLEKVKRFRLDKEKEVKMLLLDDFIKTAKETEDIISVGINNVDKYVSLFEQKRVNKVIMDVIYPLVDIVYQKHNLKDEYKIITNGEGLATSIHFNSDIIVFNPKWLNKTYKPADIEKDLDLMILTKMQDDIAKENALKLAMLEQAQKEQTFTTPKILDTTPRYDDWNFKAAKEVDAFGQVLITKTFKGTEAQIKLLSGYAKQLGMEE